MWLVWHGVQAVPNAFFKILRLTANQGDSTALELRTAQISVDYYGIK